MTRLAGLLERLTTAAERASSLDSTADALQAVSGRLPAGRVKDLLSGTAMGHPLHPAIVAVPVGAFSATVLWDIIGDDERTARRLLGLGLVSALPAVATGYSDWNETQGAERRVGLVHLVANAAGLALLGGSWLQRRNGGGGRWLAIGGFTGIGMAGWLGGHLSYGMGVGVDTTAFLRPPTEWTDACALSELVDGTPFPVTVEDTPVLLVRHGQRVSAIGDRCTHRGAPLHDGTIEDGCVTCPWHGARFRLDDGAVVRGPATRPASAFESRVVGGQVQIRRDEERSLRLNPTS